MTAFRRGLYATTVALCWAATGVSAADLKAGAALHAEHCMKCHDSGVYTREDRRISSLEGLRKQVKRCELSLNLTWFDEQVEDVVHYLNSTYYKLP